MSTLARRTALLAISLILLSLLPTQMISLVAGETTTLADGSSIDSDITIASGDILELSGAIDVADGVTITIQQGGGLEIQDTQLTTEGTGSGLLNYGETATIEIPNPIEAGTMVVEITITLSEAEEWGPTVGWSGESATNMTNASNLTLSRSMTAGEDAASITLVGRNAFGSKITTIEAEFDGAVSFSTAPLLLESTGLLPYDSQKWNLIIEGTMTMSNSTLLGAAISGGGAFEIAGSSLELSGPIALSESSTFDISNSILDGTSTDEYIEAEHGAEISWVLTSSEGDADRWITLLECQIIKTAMPESYVHITNLSYYGHEVERLGYTDENGEFELPGMCGTGTRMVEIADADGGIWQENAIIQEVTYTSALGTFGNSSIPLEYNQVFLVEMALPNVAVTAVELSSTEGVAGAPIEVTVTVTNTGSAGASVPIGCTIADGTDADVSPFAPTVIVQSGQTGDVFLDWRHTHYGEETLTCGPMLPADELSLTTVGGGEATSTPVTWDSLLEEQGDTAGTTLMVVGLGVVLIVLFAYLQRTGRVLDELADDERDADESEQQSNPIEH